MISARYTLVLLTLATVVSPASAEVMDKELSVPEVWAWGSLGALVGVLAIRRRWWSGLLSLPIAALGPVRALAESQDPHVGPAIAREAGVSYGTHAFIALIVVLAAHAAAWTKHLRQDGGQAADAP